MWQGDGIKACRSRRFVHIPPDNMKLLMISMLLLLLCSAQVLALRCYTCEGEGDDICKTETDCPASSQYCKTVQHGDQLTRTCEEFCAEDYFTTCCEEDMC